MLTIEAARRRKNICACSTPSASSDAATQARILVANPARLYGFQQPKAD